MTSTSPLAAPFVATFAIACSSFFADVTHADVIFTGLDADQEANARAFMPLAATACDTNEWRVRRLFRDADANLRQALQALGYYDIEINKSLDWTDECWRAQFNIATGEPVRLDTVEVRVDGEPLVQTGLPESVTADRPVTGQVLNHGAYRRFKNGLLQHMSGRGYFESEFSRSEVVVNPDAHSADLYLHLDRGPRYRYGDITYTDGILRESLLRQYTGIETGEYYDAAEINELYESLNGSNYFGSVSVRTDPLDEAGDTVPVDVQLTPGKRRRYSIGLGLTTDTGPQAKATYTNSRRNDRGHQLEARLFGSNVSSEASVAYRWPLQNPRTDWMNVIAGLQHEDTDTSKNDTFKLGLLRTRKFADDWLWTRYVDYAYEDFTIGQQQDVSELVILGVTFESVVGREIRRVEGGRRLAFDLRGATDALISDTNFLQLLVTGKWLTSLNPKTRLILRGKAGATVKDALSELPVSVRYFAGGDHSVRGYDFKDLGPLDENGDVIGGGYLLEGTLEVDRLIRGNWAVAAFVDSGSAFNNLEPDFSTGVGFGVRWYSPVGPVRLDFAFPLDDPDRNFRLHIVLGPDL